MSLTYDLALRVAATAEPGDGLRLRAEAFAHRYQSSSAVRFPSIDRALRAARLDPFSCIARRGVCDLCRGSGCNTRGRGCCDACAGFGFVITNKRIDNPNKQTKEDKPK